MSHLLPLTGLSSSKEKLEKLEIPRKKGRPRIERILPFQHYLGSKEGKRQRCQNKGCSKKLKKRDRMVCSKKCAIEMKIRLLDQLKTIELDLLLYVAT